MGKGINVDDLPLALANKLVGKDNTTIQVKYLILGKVLALVSKLTRREALWVLRVVIKMLIQRKDQVVKKAKSNHRGKLTGS